MEHPLASGTKQMNATKAAYRNSDDRSSPNHGAGVFIAGSPLFALRCDVCRLMIQVHGISDELASYHVSRMDLPELLRRAYWYAGAELSVTGPTSEGSTSVLPGSDAPNDSCMPVALNPARRKGGDSHEEALVRLRAADHRSSADLNPNHVRFCGRFGTDAVVSADRDDAVPTTTSDSVALEKSAATVAPASLAVALDPLRHIRSENSDADLLVCLTRSGGRNR